MPLGGCADVASQPAANPAMMVRSASPATIRDVLYVSERSQNRVDGYRPHEKNPPPFRELTQGVRDPVGMAVDSASNLYIGNGGRRHGSVAVYRPHEATPFLTYTDKVRGPVDVAVAPDGTTYISNHYGGNVTVYPPGSTTSSLTLTPPANAKPFGVTTDTTGRAYVAYALAAGGGVIYAYDAGESDGQDLGIALSGAPHGVVIDRNGNLIVAVNASGSGSDIEVYPPGATQPSQRLSGPTRPMMLALNPNENRLYVADFGTGNNDGAVFVFSYPSGSLRSKDTQGAAASPYGVIFDRS